MAGYSIFPPKQSHDGVVEIGIADGHHVDAFSRLRTAHPDTIFDSTFQYDLQPLIYQAVTANSATAVHSPADAGALLTVTTAAGSEVYLQSKQYHRYIPGKSQLIVMTGVFGAAVADVRRRAGYFDAANGIYLEQNGTTDVAFVRRTNTSGSVVNNRVVQSDWNIDVFDGSGRRNNPSHIALDLSKGQILLMDLQWLGMGRVRVGFDIDGVFYPAHHFNNSNALTTVYMRTANLPNRWEITNLASATGTMLAGCCSVQSEGGGDRHFSYTFAYDRASFNSGNGSQAYAFSVRPKSTFNSITNRMLIRPTLFDCLVTGNSPVRIEVYYGTTIGGTPSWSDMDATYSGLQVDTAGTPSGGIKVESFDIASTNQSRGAVSQAVLARYPLTLDAAGTGYNHFTVYATGIGAASACSPGMHWEEIR